MIIHILSLHNIHSFIIHKVGAISKRSSEKWKSLPPEERAIWDAKAEADKKRYNLEKEKYTGPWQVPWKRAKKVSFNNMFLLKSLI